jgi:radical SAM protein
MSAPYPLRTPFDERPFLAIWEVTQACDLVCAHCRACATAERDPMELRADEGKALLSRLARMGVPLVVLTGGDPAKRPDLEELVAHGTREGLSVAVTPSGTPLMTRERIAGLAAAGMRRIAVSVDGHDAPTHDAFRGVPGSFRESMRILHTAAELGIPAQINTSVGPHNAARLGEMARLVGEVGAVLWSVFFVVPTGRATGLYGLTAPGVEALLEELERLGHEVTFDIKTTAAPHFRRVQMTAHGRPTGVHQEVDERGLVKGPRGINDGCGFVFVSHRGDIFPSGFLPLPAGNVRSDDLASIYRHHPLFVRLRDADALEGKCGACPFRRVCGGSRARAFAATGDPMASDPSCAYIPKGWGGEEEGS